MEKENYFEKVGEAGLGEVDVGVGRVFGLGFELARKAARVTMIRLRRIPCLGAAGLITGYLIECVDI